MVWRFLYKFLLNDKVVDKLADSYPIRRAAQWVVYYFNKTKAIGLDETISSRVKRVALRKLSERLEEKLKKIKDDLETKSKKF